VVVHGQATQTTHGNQLLVTTQNGAGTKHAAIDWQSFSIPKGSGTYFQQPDAASTVINRVVTNTPSLLFGNLGSNGRVVLVNHTGVTVGAGATVDTAGFTASALRMSDADALAGRLRFGSATESGGNVSVQGSVVARTGDVVLIGSHVATGPDALVRSPNGSTVLAAGQQVELTGRGLDGISMLVRAPTDAALNLGTLQGDAVGVFAGTLKTTGTIAATAVSAEGGKVFLKAADRAEVGGTVSALGQAGQGGQVHVTADKVALLADALVDVSGERGGGEALIGGGYLGKDARLDNARRTAVQAGARIRADALGSGIGGTVVVWSDEATQFLGRLSARGGLLGGNGGFAEVSGKRFLEYRGQADLGAFNGAKGSLLLDPYNLTIGYGGAPVLGDILASTDPGTDSFITASSLSELLTNANVSLAAVNDIEVNQAVTGNHSLTLTAGNTIRLNADIDLTVDPSGYGSPVLSTELNLNAGPGGIVGGPGAITVNRLRISSLGQVLLGASSGVFHRVGNLHSESGGNLEFRNRGDLALQDITSFGAQVSISVSDGRLQIEGAVDLHPVGGGQDTLTLSASGDIYQAGGSVKATRLDASAQNISLVGYGNLVTSASFFADVNSGDIGLSNDRSIELRDVRGRGLGLYNVAGDVTQAETSSIRVFSSDFDVTGDIRLQSEDNLFRRITIFHADHVWMRSNNNIAPIVDSADSFSIAPFASTASASDLTLGRINAESFELQATNDIFFADTVRTSVGNVRVSTASGRLSMRGEGVASIESAGSIHLTARNGIEVGHLTANAAGDAIELETYTYNSATGDPTMGFDASAGSVSLPGGGRWLIRLSHDAWNTTNAHLNLGSGLPEPQFGAAFTPNFKQYGYIGAAPLGVGNGVIYGQSVSLQGVTLAGQTSKTYDGLQSIGFTGLSLVNPSTKLPQVPQTGNSDNLSHATLQGGSAQLDTANVGTGKTVRVLRVVYGGVTAPEGNNLTVYYSDLYSQNISGPVGTVLPASPSIDPPPQVPSDVPTQLSSTLLLLQQQPYGTSGAIVDAALRGQPTAWPSPLVPTDPVFGQRDRANEGVLAEGEICVR
jgi:filamentous hemagglutinin family protein